MGGQFSDLPGLSVGVLLIETGVYGRESMARLDVPTLLLAALLGTLLVSGDDAIAQARTKPPRIGVVVPHPVRSGPNEATPEYMGARVLVRKLRDLGWRDSQDIQIIWRVGADDVDRVPEYLQDLLRQSVDVLVVDGNRATRLAMAATKRVPIVAIMGNPVEDGLVRSLAQPERNLTGVSVSIGSDLNGKRLSILKQIAPQATRVAFFPWRMVGEATLPSSPETSAAARALGMTVLTVSWSKLEDLKPALERARREGANAMCIAGALRFSIPEYQRVVHEFAELHRMPVIYGFEEAVDTGGLVAYSPDFNSAWERAAVLVDKIVKGAAPVDVPIEQVDRHRLSVNLKTARNIGVKVSPAVLLQADRVLE